MNAALNPTLASALFAPPPLSDDGPSRHHRTIWISDLHLGTAGCKADFLLDFLKCNDADTLYLVGDIIDGWQLKKGWTWRQSHNDVVQKILRKARKGTTSSRALMSSMRSAASKSSTKRPMSRRTANACWSRMATCSTE
jgi:hypothetical protein